MLEIILKSGVLTERQANAVRWVESTERAIQQGSVPPPPHFDKVQTLLNALVSNITYGMFVRERAHKQYEEWLVHHGLSSPLN